MKKFTIILSSLLLTVLTFGQNTHREQSRQAVVALSSIYMRTAPDYESALETQELMGTVVEVTGQNGYWREIVSPQPYKAWCTQKGIIEMTPEVLKAYQDAPKCMFTELYGHVYEQPSYKSQTVCDLVGGDILRMAGNDGKETCNGQGDTGKGHRKRSPKGWTNVIIPDGTEGWVKSECIRLHEGFRSIAKGEGCAGSISDTQMEEIIATAFLLKGVPYLWGGMTPKGVDCSGLVRWSYLMNGILLPRNASQMVHCGDEVPISLPQNGKAAGIENLRRGDLVFFGTPATDEKPRRVTHVGIYIGNNHIIHSSHLVRVNSLIPGEADYYENAHKLIAARRL
jgi:SH3-like domain-containing protein